jgi:Uma2 family endonuclease
MTVGLPEPQTRRWTRREYYKLAEKGWFAGQRVQLIDGEIIQMAPQGHEHTVALSKAARILRTLFEPGHWIRWQMPLNVGRDSDPEPDLAVVKGDIDDYTDHPTTAILVVEVSDTSLRLDRRKAALYASAGVGEYWILNLVDRSLEVYRTPVPADGGEKSAHYASHVVLDLNAEVAPQAAPARAIRVSSLFPSHK